MAASADGGAPPPPPPSLLRPRRWPRRLLVGVNAVVLCVLLIAAAVFGYVEWRFSEVKRISVAGLVPTGSSAQSPPGGQPPITLLLIGSDSRSLGKGGSAAFGSSQEVSGQRSDTIMLARVEPATSSIALLSIPRDLLVAVPGLGTTRINAAFNSGPDLLVKTIEQDFGIDINHVAVVNFDSFIQVADAVGGVYVYFPTPARDLFSGLTVTHPGCVLLKGSQALAFVRSREYQYLLDGTWQYQLYPESDLARIQRQQAFIKLALKKAEEVAFGNPFALNRVISGLTSSLTVDNSFSVSGMIKLALALRHADAAGIPNWTYPTVNSTVVAGALDAVPSLDQQVIDEFLNYGAPKHEAAPAGASSASQLAPSSVSVEVLNGSGLEGQAAQAASALNSDGFKVSSTGNASNFNYQSSVIEYGNGGAAAAKLLEPKVSGGATLQDDSSLSGDHLVLITGQTFSSTSGSGTTTSVSVGSGAGVVQAVLTAVYSAGVYSMGGLAPETTPSDEIEPSSSSYYHGEYVAPGLQPGKVPEVCPQ